MADGVIEVKLSLKGRPIREFVFAESRITIGRDPQSHIFLDNPGISRCHATLVRENDGVYLDDQESANGTFLNEAPVTRAEVKNGDRIRVGKFLLVLALGSERRAEAAGAQRTAFPESTMMLEPAQIDRLMHQTKRAEQEAAERAGVPHSVPMGNVLRVRDVASRPSYETTAEPKAGPMSAVPMSSLEATRPPSSPPLRMADTRSASEVDETTSKTMSPSAPQISSHRAAAAAPRLSLHATSPGPPARDSHSLPPSPRSGPATGAEHGIVSWVRAHLIALEVGFTAGLAVGIVIAKMLLG